MILTNVESKGRAFTGSNNDTCPVRQVRKSGLNSREKGDFIRRRVFQLALLFALTSCGYHWGNEYPQGVRPTLFVPYVGGDDDGLLTTELISTLNTSGLVDIDNRSGDYRLQVCVVQNQNDTVGYRRDPQKIKNKIRHQLISSEGRRSLEVDVTLFKGSTEEIEAGPYRVKADVDYDYVDGDSYPQLTFISSSGETVVVLPFSLGQLESIESAQEASLRPLYRKISQKIVDVISAEW